MKKVKKTWTTYAILGDQQSKATTILMKDLIYVDKVLAPYLAEKMRRFDALSMKDQRALGYVMNISFYCLGGNIPLLDYKENHTDCKWKLYDPALYDDYLALYCKHFLTNIRTFDRSRGSWPARAKFIRMATTRDVGRLYKKARKVEELENEWYYNNYNGDAENDVNEYEYRHRGLQL